MSSHFLKGFFNADVQQKKNDAADHIDLCLSFLSDYHPKLVTSNMRHGQRDYFLILKKSSIEIMLNTMNIQSLHC